MRLSGKNSASHQQGNNFKRRAGKSLHVTCSNISLSCVTAEKLKRYKSSGEKKGSQAMKRSGQTHGRSSVSGSGQHLPKHRQVVLPAHTQQSLSSTYTGIHVDHSEVQSGYGAVLQWKGGHGDGTWRSSSPFKASKRDGRVGQIYPQAINILPALTVKASNHLPRISFEPKILCMAGNLPRFSEYWRFFAQSRFFSRQMELQIKNTLPAVIKFSHVP